MTNIYRGIKHAPQKLNQNKTLSSQKGLYRGSEYQTIKIQKKERSDGLSPRTYRGVKISD